MKSGERIPLGDGCQPGPFAPGLQSSPVGTAYVFGNEEPDLFVVANLHSLDPGPGLYLYEWKGRNEQGIPVFAAPQKVTLSLIDPTLRGIHDTSPSLIGSIFQTKDELIHGWWLDGSEIYRTVLDKESLTFNLSFAGKISMTGLPDVPETPSTHEVIINNDGSIQILLAINDGVIHRPEGYWRHPEYIMYDGAGVFKGKWPYEYLYISDTISIETRSPVNFKSYSLTRREVLQGYHSLTFVEYEKGEKKQIAICK